MSQVTLTQDQQDAHRAFLGFMSDPALKYFVLQGYAGTGKSTLVEHILDSLKKNLDAMQLISPNLFIDWSVKLTATTNKAAEALQTITRYEVVTIHKLLKMRVKRDYKSNETMIIFDPETKVENLLLFIDEASYLDERTLGIIEKLTPNCKIVLIGDPAQLAPVNFSNTPAFEKGYMTAKLENIVRQAHGNPIIDLSTKFRETVKSGEFFQFTPDGVHIQHMVGPQFGAELLNEFSRPDWTFTDSKVLAWTNKTVIQYNHWIRDQVQGDPHLHVGDYALCNNYLKIGRDSLKTDEMVQVTGLTAAGRHKTKGAMVQMNHHISAFMPESLQARKTALAKAKANNDAHALKEITEEWVDLRAAYACTINKSQGSTYRQVFIDLDDIAKCHDMNQVARMLYVAVSRASERVVFTGDLV